MPKLKFFVFSFIIIIYGFFLLILQPGFCLADSDRQKYIQADNCYKNLRHSPAKQKYREFWFNCIDGYQKIFIDNPSSSWAPAGMYRSAELYLELYKRSYKKSDLQEGIDLFQRVIKRYPESLYSKKAKRKLDKLADNATMSTETSEPKESPPSTPSINEIIVAEESASPSASSQNDDNQSDGPNDDGLVTGLRFWSNPEYTRVVIDAQEMRDYSHHLLKENPALNKPSRLYVDLEQTRLGKDVPKHTTINDDLLIQARAGQYAPHTVRVVIDIKSFDNYKVFSLKDPFRLVIDVWGKTSVGDSTPSGNSEKLVRVTTDNLQSSSIARQLALGVTKIVIDPGHGGKDPGAPGRIKGIWEKDIVLAISKKLAEKMQNRLECKVELTRTKDVYLTLEERTAIANTKNADLFISLHCNASSNTRLAGIETYYLNLATDEQAITVAARENATSRKNISDLESILNDLMKNAKINESSRLAVKVQKHTTSGLSKNYSKITSLGVKQAPFYVLLGARMPSILIETSFLSNIRECKRLMDKDYQEKLCDAIIDGIEAYIKETNPKFL